MTTITITTRLHAGLDSADAGQDRIHYTYTASPSNLVRAAKRLHEHRVAMREGYGNVGCGASWLSIDGELVDDFYLDELAYHDLDTMSEHDRRAWRRGDRVGILRPQSPTDKAAALLARVGTKVAR